MTNPENSTEIKPGNRLEKILFWMFDRCVFIRMWIEDLCAAARRLNK